MTLQNFDLLNYYRLKQLVSFILILGGVGGGKGVKGKVSCRY